VKGCQKLRCVKSGLKVTTDCEHVGQWCWSEELVSVGRVHSCGNASRGQEHAMSSCEQVLREYLEES